MVINGFTIEGILNIEHASLMLESMNALIAPNGYGKSNMLRAIEFGIRVPSATGRCSRHLEVAPLQLALSLIADSSVMFLHDVARQIASVAISNIETLFQQTPVGMEQP